MANEKHDACGVPHQCQREIPTWLVLLDNVPTLILFGLGAVLVGRLWWPLAALFLVYCGAAILLFWGRICPYCPHFGTRACPCGYGVLAPRFFRSRVGTEGKDFRTVFRRNIGIMFPCWLVPLGIGLMLLWRERSLELMVLLGVFCLVGFVAIPLISLLVGCRACEIKDQCPWMGRR